MVGRTGDASPVSPAVVTPLERHENSSVRLPMICTTLHILPGKVIRAHIIFHLLQAAVIEVFRA